MTVYRSSARKLATRPGRPGSRGSAGRVVFICGVWRPAAQRTLERQGREGRGAQWIGDLHKKVLLSWSAGSGRAVASVPGGRSN
ncbi:hypothetical protein EVAR_56320_1 [Eumeta japonica]|uniref:Uncharacterized protein n=1 Tax=Eumeta variegata TaxID=151549 RepID=A0A4C1YBE9_EUMVA|nr:hypothetical protein EVAR_56320_1 [Eumeta japonica]